MISTAAGYKTRSNVPNTDDDAVIAVLLAEAESTIARFLNRTLEDSGTNITETLNGTGTDTLYLSAYPITAFTSVSYLSSVASGAASYTAFDASTYFRNDATGKLVRSGYYDYGFGVDESVWPLGTENIQVVYQGGYDSSSAPGWLLEGIYEYTDLLWYARGGITEAENAPTATDPAALEAWLWANLGHARRATL